ncbi:MAG: choice-of-anchor L domain-containing protein [Crocinitomicaceae bacterium]|nr:choice-of-anchor L domain-containing protein [Crocinitomicaceae bacterium]MDG1659589.1 choice-of-anchor L domain-containing protein [Crocinitomicaceae bacterium]|tara:strand:+ start:9155 stop:11377 length:2223 start_codon:yes stop_codon:yes gene_type:complete
MQLRKLLALAILVLLGTTMHAQISVNNTLTPADMVNALIGPGVTVSNISFTGQGVQAGSFDGSMSNIGLDNGIIISSGTILDIVPPNQPTTGTFGQPGDPDLLTIAQSVLSNPAAASISATADAAYLEFDFVPVGDSVEFNFVFASEEYQTYINTSFNDAFGFFISGPGFAGPYASPAAFTMGAENLAFVPGTTDPITISTIHPGLNPAFYIDDPVGATQSFNGFTTPMKIEFQVVCGMTYHFKFAVADCQDDFLDTGVFLEGGSFSSDAVSVAVTTVSGDTAVYEGCTFADFIFSRPDTSDTLIINYSLSGTGQEGTDFAALTNPVTFLPGQDTIILTLNPIADGLIEPGESVTITAFTISPCGDTIISSGTVWIFDEPDMYIDESDTIIYCADDSVLVTAFAGGGFSPYLYSWTGSTSTTSQAYVAGSLSGPVEYYVTATDGCGYSVTDTVTVTLNQTLAIDNVSSLPSSTCTPTGSVNAVTSGETGVAIYNWTGPGLGGGSSASLDWQNVSPGWYYFTVTDNICVETDSIEIVADPTPISSFTGSPISGCAPLSVNFANSSINGTSYEWNFDGTIVNAPTMASQTHVFTTSGLVQLVAFDDGGCSDTTTISISVTPCGCTDPAAENYNPLASIDDGSCIYAQPTVVCPNIFTPNDDNLNDVFKLDVTNAIDVEFTILNRWGNVMYETSGLAPFWNGETPSGAPAEDGTYFVNYTVTGIDGTTQITGHGFVQLVAGDK